MDSASKLTHRELFAQSIDDANSPFISQRGMLVWNGTAWEKWDGQAEKTATADEGSGAVTVGNTTTVLAAANADRKEIVICNDSDEPIYLGYGTNAVMNQGVRLNAYGGTIVETVWTGSINAICSSGTKEATYVEM